MKLKTLLATSAAICLACPALAWADPPSDQGPKAGDDHRSQTQGARPTKPSRPAARSVAPSDRRPGPAAPAHEAARPVAPREPAPTPDDHGVRASRIPDEGGPSMVRPAPERVGPPRVVDAAAPSRASRTARPPADIARLGAWTRPPSGPARERAAQTWRQGHHDWDSAAPWRRNSNWWRGDDAFTLFEGARVGFFFVPERGYVPYPAGYNRQDWAPGQYLPRWAWGYDVQDYWNYGLPQAPDGCAWTWLDTSIALIDTSDGYILDIVPNAW